MTEGVEVKVEGLASLEAKIHKLAGPQMMAALRAANEKNAEEFRSLVASICPRGDDAKAGGRHLVDTLEKKAVGPMGFEVSIGNQGSRYPLHLEAGHRDRGGGHVPGKPFWRPALRVQRTRWRRRTARAVGAAAKQIVGSATTSPVSGS
jgi:hypothetical protein